MKKFFLIPVLLFISFLFSQSSEVIKFADQNFKKILLKSSNTSIIAKNNKGEYFKIDMNEDGEIQKSEAEEVIELKLKHPRFLSYTNLSGIKFFKNITTLHLDVDMISSTIDLSHMKKLKNIEFSRTLEIQGNLLLNNTSINNVLNLESFSCNNIDISNTNITHIELGDPSRQEKGYKLNKLIAKNCPMLETIYSYNSSLTNQNKGIVNVFNELIIDNCPKFKQIASLNEENTILYPSNWIVTNCNNIKEIKSSKICIVNNCLNLTSVNSSSELYTYKCPKLNKVVFIGNQKKKFNLNDSYPNIISLSLASIDSVNLQLFSNLISLDWSDFQMNNPIYLDQLRKGNTIENLTINGDFNKLKFINHHSLKNITCLNNSLKNVYIENCENLENLNILESISRENQPNLTDNIKNLESVFIKNTKLSKFIVNDDGNKHDPISWKSMLNLKSLTIEDCPYMSIVSLVDFPITTFKIRNCNSLEKLILRRSSLEGILEVKNFPNLNEIFFTGTGHISNFILNNAPKLKYFNLFGLVCGSENIEYIDPDYQRVNNFELSDLPLVKKIEIHDLNTDHLNLSKLQNLERFTRSIYGYNRKPSVKSLNLKNGKNLIEYSPLLLNQLKTICVDSELEKKLIIENNEKCIENNTTYESENHTLDNHNAMISTDCMFNKINVKISLASKNNKCKNTSYNICKLKVDSPEEGTIYYSNSKNDYQIYTKSHKLILTPIIDQPNYIKVVPKNSMVNFNSKTHALHTVENFCVKSENLVKNLDITIIPLNNAIPGSDATYRIICKNYGTSNESGSINFSYDPNYVKFVSSNTLTAISSNNPVFDKTIKKWDFSDLLPFQEKTIDITFKINNSTHNTYPLKQGNILKYSAWIMPNIGPPTVDNFFELAQEVVNFNVDNKKTCLQGKFVTSNMIGNYVNYVIRFQNNKNYLAVNVLITDKIDSNLFDINSLIVTSSSDDYELKIIEREKKVEFFFKNINLEPQKFEKTSRFIAFKIQTNPNLNFGETLKNQANIYFDFQNPITTNEEKSKIEMLSHEKLSNLKSQLAVIFYPNPAKDVIIFNNESEVKNIKIFDLHGKLARSEIVYGKEMNISELQPGNYIIKIQTKYKTKTTRLIKK